VTDSGPTRNGSGEAPDGSHGDLWRDGGDERERSDGGHGRGSSGGREYGSSGGRRRGSGGREHGSARSDETGPVETTGAVIGDLVARERRSGAPALVAVARDRTYSYFDLCNTAAKAGNVLRHVGVRPGDTVAVEPRHDPEVTLTTLGGALIGATVTYETGVGDAGESRAAVGDAGESRAAVVHAETESAVDPSPGTSLVVFGDSPSTTGATHWESEVWSENPAVPPAPTEPDDPAIQLGAGNPSSGHDDRGSVSHRRLLRAATRVRDRLELDTETAVVLGSDPTDPRSYAAGVLAPLAAGGTVVLPRDDSESALRAAVERVAGGDGDATEPTLDCRRTVAVGDTDLTAAAAERTDTALDDSLAVSSVAFEA
jgi:hypothetical protein